ncbi:MAG: aspartate aminotransferase family protein [Deltaproteobacteria bacterium]|nr:aspartate aminotransferase family protein [Deltaproteobacteria bacterium]
MRTYGRQPLALVKGDGCRVWDADGKEYLDFVAGLAVCNLGHAHPEVARAAAEQLAKLVHVSNLYYTAPMTELAEELVRLSFADRVFFANSGAEVNEGAIKLCRRYSRERYGEGRHFIISTYNSFHGRTLGALSATGQEKFHKGFEPLLEGFIFVPFNDLEAAARAADERVCAVLVEPIQGEGGVCLPDADYLAGLRRLCDDQGLLLVFDEVQTGLGRTGEVFAHEHYGVTPDVMTLAKALANGLPMGALLTTEDAARAFVPGTHASTFGGGPVIAAAALTALRLLSQPEFLAQVRVKGQYVKNSLKLLQEQFTVIKEIRGLGLMWGIELDREGGPVVDFCRERGLLLNCTQGNVIRLLPPLTVNLDEINRGLQILTAALVAV